MLFTVDVLNKIKSGEVTAALRKWKKPTVKKDGTLITSIGQLHIDDLKTIKLDDITDGILTRCGINDFRVWKKKFYDKRDGDLYLVEFSIIGPDPRIELRENINWSLEELIKVKKKLNTWDINYGSPWTLRVMQYILDHPQKRAADMAVDLGIEKSILKPNIRKLKALGLTISYSVGYDLSPRGKKLLEVLKAGD